MRSHHAPFLTLRPPARLPPPPPPATLPPPQLVVRRNPSPDPRFQPETATASLVSYDFKPGARALFLGRSHYGCMATVLPDASAGLTKKVGGWVGGRGWVSKDASQSMLGFCCCWSGFGAHNVRAARQTVQHPPHAAAAATPPTPLLPQGQQLVAGAAQRRSVFRVSLEPGPTNMATIAQAGAVWPHPVQSPATCAVAARMRSRCCRRPWRSPAVLQAFARVWCTKLGVSPPLLLLLPPTQILPLHPPSH